MNYTRLNLSNGTVIDETHFKHIEDGIVAAVTAINESSNGAGGGYNRYS